MNLANTASLAFARRGETLLRERRLNEAVQVLSEGVRRHPSYLTGFLILGRAYKETGLLTEATVELDNVLRLDARCPAALNLLAEIAQESGDHGQEAMHLGQLSVQEPWDEGYQSAYRRSRALSAPIPKSPAMERAEEKTKIVAATPAAWLEEEFGDEEDDSESVPNVATITLAEIYFQQGLKEQALQIYRQILDYQPDNQPVQKRIGEIEASITLGQ